MLQEGKETKTTGFWGATIFKSAALQNLPKKEAESQFAEGKRGLCSNKDLEKVWCFN